ncbi:MAG TPA: amidohydrolase family protein [Pyrinomonadaceae bacterium]|jgi:5-methylthioadenosine/S-adenosylhomocysteine deaminase|nr:amidohydrolase family protein [Pyrinomonadaceae bacterium]
MTSLDSTNNKIQPPTRLYCARWVVPVASPPFEDGAVAVAGASIVGVGSRPEVEAQFPGAAREDFGEAVVIPGLVNCHSHLELTAMRGYLEDVESDFFAWLRKLTIARMTRMTADDLRVSATWGALEAARAGVTTLGDACNAGDASMSALLDVGLRGNVYQEAIHPDERAADEMLSKLKTDVARLRERENGLVRVGVSPHSPYTMSEKLLVGMTDYALEEKLPLMIHAAESEYEDELLKHGRGRFAESYVQRGLDWPSPHMSPVQYLSTRGVLTPHTLLAHCVRVDAADIETIREAGASVAHCPKSNLKLGHGRAPYTKMSGIRRGFGSDSVASNNTCDILEEARFATLLARLDQTDASGELYNAQEALHDATLGGARALGYEENLGALRVGDAADLAIFRLDGAHQIPVYDPAHALIFSTSARDAVLTMVAGREVYRDGQVLTVDEERLRARMTEIRRKVTSDG